MGILNFIKDMFREQPEQEIKEKKIYHSEIEDFLKNKINETKEKEKEVISNINKKVELFIEELKGGIILVNSVNIDAKEKNEKIKSIVYEGRKKYIEFLERFIEKIKEAQKIEELKKFAEIINAAFLRLNENSGKSYERATILIGKEMGNLKDILKRFSNELLEVFNENKEIIPLQDKLYLVKSKIESNKDSEKDLENINKEIKNIENKISNNEKEIKNLSERIEKIKNSREHKENLEKINLISLKEEELKEEIIKLKQATDFKSLSNFFHIFEDKMLIIKSYKDNFIEEFKRDKGKRILNLLEESNINTEEIKEKINQIKKQEKDIENLKDNIKEDETKHLSYELEKAESELNETLNEKKWKEKNKEKLKEIKEENLKKIKEELKSMNLTLEDEKKGNSQA